MSNLLEPWIFLRAAAGIVAFVLFARAAFTAQTVLRRFDVGKATEGQLALEKRLELAATFARVAGVVQVLTLLLSVLAADRLSRGIRGAMCAYGVFASTPSGSRSLAVTAFVAVFAGIFVQVLAFDSRVRSLALAKPVAKMAIGMFVLSSIDLGAAFQFLGSLDLDVVASCCSTDLGTDSAPLQSLVSHSGSVVAASSVLFTLAAIGIGVAVARSPTRSRILIAALATALAIPPVALAIAREVAPHALEVPNHECPFCLFRSDAFALGYPLFGALFFAIVWSLGAGVSALLSKNESSLDALADFAPSRLRLGVRAWVFVLVIGILPLARFAIVTGGASLR